MQDGERRLYLAFEGKGATSINKALNNYIKCVLREDVTEVRHTATSFASNALMISLRTLLAGYHAHASLALAQSMQIQGACHHPRSRISSACQFLCSVFGCVVCGKTQTKQVIFEW